MLSRTLSAVILVLTLLSGAVLLTNVSQYDSVDMKPPQQEESAAERMLSVPSQVLSRFSMFPIFRDNPVPIAVMIENHQDARPHQEGLEEALMVQEFLVEGFISRFITLFDSNNLPPEVGPVRSLRPYFLDSVLPWTRTVFHAGGSPEALDRVKNSGEFYALNLLYYDDEHGSLRHKDVAPPHNLFLKKSFLTKLLKDVPEKFLPESQWPPFTIGMPEGGEVANEVKLNFFSTVHNVQYEFLPLAGKYKRTNGATVTNARPSNVVILEVPIDEIGAYGRLFMSLEGSGRAMIFHSGKKWQGRWSRNSISEPFRIVDAAGKDIPLVRGQVWVTVLPTLDRVSFE